MLRRVGLVTSNSIRQVFQRTVMGQHLFAKARTSRLMVVPNYPWTKLITAEHLDGRRQHLPAEHPHLTLAGLYTVLQKLRVGTAPDALIPDDRRRPQSGACPQPWP